MSVTDPSHTGPQRSTVELLGLPWVFTQLKPLTAQDFLKEVRRRNVDLTEPDLEAMHKKRILVPLLRASRDGRTLRAEVRAQRGMRFRHDHWDPTWLLGTQRL